MGKDTISSQELADYTHVNSTQIRRDLSGFGKFGKRGVGYNVDSLVSQIRKILRTSGQHNIALFGAGHLGQAIAGSSIFADHGFRVVALFDTDPDKIGTRGGREPDRALGRRPGAGGAGGGDRGGRDRRAHRGGPAGGGRARAGRGEDHLQLLRGAAAGAARGHRARLVARPWTCCTRSTSTWPEHAGHDASPGGLRGLRGLHRRHRGGVRHPRSRDARPGAAVRGAARRGPGRPGAGRVGGRRADRVRDRDHLRARRRPGRRPGPPARAPRAPVRPGRAPGRDCCRPRPRIPGARGRTRR